MTMQQQCPGTVLRNNLIAYGLTLPGAYEDYPFGDGTATLRHRGNQRIFALFLKHDGKELLNLKCNPYDALFLRHQYPSIIPAFHMNKVHWNSIILDCTVPDELIREMIRASHELTGSKIRKQNIQNWDEE